MASPRDIDPGDPQGRSPSEHTPAAIGKYRILRRLGSGAFGVVYQCQDPDLGRLVAVKVLVGGGWAGAEAAGRFEREARAVARLSHPNIVPVFDAGRTAEGSPYLVMEFINGPSLDQLIATPQLTSEAAVRIVFHLALALQAAHDCGVIHRDVKPGNVIIDASGRPRLADFGLALVAEDRDGRLSRTGDLIGTPRYLSPEQAQLPPGAIDGRADQYALGAVFYELLAGIPAVNSETSLGALRAVLDEEPIPLEDRNPQVTSEMATVCRRMMAKDRDHRYPSMKAAAEAIQQGILRDCLGPEGTGIAFPSLTSRRKRLALVALAVGFLAFGGLGFGLGRAMRSFPVAHTTMPNPVADPDQVADEARRNLAHLATVTDDAQYLAALGDFFAKVGSAIEAYPDRVDLRVLRGRLSRRVGEPLAALADLRGASAEELLERTLARYQWEVVCLGVIAESPVRPPPSKELLSDLAELARSGEPSVRQLGGLGRKVVVGSARTAIREPLGSIRADLFADASMFEADALTRAADETHEEVCLADGDQRPPLRAARDEFFRRAEAVLAKGLSADPRHPGLLLLRADSVRRAEHFNCREKAEQRPLNFRSSPAKFVEAYGALRQTQGRERFEHAVARSILLANHGTQAWALDQFTDAAPMPREMIPYRAWLHLQAGQGGSFNPTNARRALDLLDSHFRQPPDQFAYYYVRAVALAGMGEWQAAGEVLRAGRRTGTCPTCYSSSWCRDVDAPPAWFAQSTAAFLDELDATCQIRIQVQGEALKMLTGPDPVPRGSMAPDAIQAITAWSHYRQASNYAEGKKWAEVLHHTRAALALKAKGVDPDLFRNHNLLQSVNQTPEFKALYSEFERK